jgi:hypothetical protein
MSWFNKVNPVIAQHNRRIEELERELQRYKDALQEERDQIKRSSRSAPFSFDFNSVKAFSVERNLDGNLPVTVIGYLLPIVTDGKETFAVKEWYLHCDDARHEEIIQAFKETRK